MRLRQNLRLSTRESCGRAHPYIDAGNAKYKDDGPVIIGVHTPEFPFEKDESNVRKAVYDRGVTHLLRVDGLCFCAAFMR
jgi:hypothetical protein